MAIGLDHALDRAVVQEDERLQRQELQRHTSDFSIVQGCGVVSETWTDRRRSKNPQDEARGGLRDGRGQGFLGIGREVSTID